MPIAESRQSFSNSLPALTVVLSFYNEEKVIPELLRRLSTTLSTLIEYKQIKSYELLFVNDASTDNSLSVLLQAQRNNRSIRIVNMSRNFGVSPCVMAGFDFAQGDLIVYMDSDLQDPPEVIPDLVAKWREGYDVVHTIRKQRRGETRIKLMLTKLGYKILGSISDVPIQPNSGDFKLLSRRALMEVRKFNEKAPFTRGIVTWIGFAQAHVYYDRDARFEGKTKFPIFSYKVISNFFDSAIISFSDKPLKAVSMLGLFVSAASFLLLAHVLIQKMMGYNIPGWTAIMVTISFLGGIQLVAIGVVGLYINSIFIETKRRPNYIVSEVLEADKHLDVERLQSPPLN
jgi:glycosyltransferase involved in cell wall biosynthesis